MSRIQILTCDCHHLQHEGEPLEHMERYGQKRALGKHPGESFYTFGKHFDQHAASALQINPTVKMRYLIEKSICTLIS